MRTCDCCDIQIPTGEPHPSLCGEPRRVEYQRQLLIKTFEVMGMLPAGSSTLR